MRAGARPQAAWSAHGHAPSGTALSPSSLHPLWRWGQGALRKTARAAAPREERPGAHISSPHARASPDPGSAARGAAAGSPQPPLARWRSGVPCDRPGACPRAAARLRDGHAAILVAALHVEDGRLAVQPEAGHVQARAQQPARVVPHVCPAPRAPRASARRTASHRHARTHRPLAASPRRASLGHHDSRCCSSAGMVTSAAGSANTPSGTTAQETIPRHACGRPQQRLVRVSEPASVQMEASATRGPHPGCTPRRPVPAHDGAHVAHRAIKEKCRGRHQPTLLVCLQTCSKLHLETMAKKTVALSQPGWWTRPSRRRCP